MTGRAIILAEVAPNHYNVIDGHHRLEKARKSGIETVQHIPFIVSRKGYEPYVGYWNDKLKNMVGY